MAGRRWHSRMTQWQMRRRRAVQRTSRSLAISPSWASWTRRGTRSFPTWARRRTPQQRANRSPCRKVTTRRSTRSSCARRAWRRIRRPTAICMCAASTRTCNTASTTCCCRKASPDLVWNWIRALWNHAAHHRLAAGAYGFRTAGVVDITDQERRVRKWRRGGSLWRQLRHDPAQL